MLKMVLGVSGTGKSHCMLQEAEKLAQQGQKCAFLVPEQFTSSMESRLYDRLGDGLSGSVRCYSFTSLSELILKQFGGSSVKSLSEPARIVLLRRALIKMGTRVKIYSRHTKNLTFLKHCIDVIEEMKNAGIDSKMLETIAGGMEIGSDKMLEISEIMGFYEAELGASLMDPGDRVTLAAKKLMEEANGPTLFSDTTFFVDEFDDFDVPKQMLLGEILRTAPKVYVSVCAPSIQLINNGLELFGKNAEMGRKVIKLAHKNSCHIETPLVLDQYRRWKDDSPLVNLSNLLLSDRSEWFSLQNSEQENTLIEFQQRNKVQNAVVFHKAENRAREVLACGAYIQKQVRKGAKYGDFVVICRDEEAYITLVSEQFSTLGIPVFVPQNGEAEASAPVRAVLALLMILKTGFTTENILNLAKTGLCDLTEKELAALDDYAFTWNPRAAEWKKPFENNPAGINGVKFGEREKRQLALAEAGRNKLISTLSELKEKSEKSSAEQLTELIYLSLCKLGAEKRTKEKIVLLEKNENLQASEEEKRLWNLTIALLEQMADLLKEEQMTVSEYYDLFSLLARSAELEHIPQKQDAVLFVSAAKMKLDAPRCCCILGLGEGEFPALPSEDMLLSHADREAISESGKKIAASLENGRIVRFELPNGFESRLQDENMLFYKAMTGASEKLWLSFSENNSGNSITSALNVLLPTEIPAPDLNPEDYCTTSEACVDRLGSLWSVPECKTEKNTLRKVCSELSDTLFFKFEEAEKRKTPSITAKEEMKTLLGNKISISASKLKRYSECPYNYYFQYVLNAKTRKQARFDPAAGGTLVHYVLEMALQDKLFMSMGEEELKQLANKHTQEFLNQMVKEPTREMRYVSKRVASGIGGLLRYIQREQEQGLFRPVAFELKIGEQNDQITPKVLRTNDGTPVQGIGTIDRVDLCKLPETGENWVRVIDYKTGEQTFSLEDVLYGIDCQMLLYLFTLMFSGIDNLTPKGAGVLYLRVDPAPEKTTRQKAMLKNGFVYEVDGLVCDNEKVQLAMDREGISGFVPTNRNKIKQADEGMLQHIENYIDGLLVSMAERLCDGKIGDEPLVTNSKTPCTFCDYKLICSHREGEGERVKEKRKDLFVAEEQVIWEQ